jgi:hypothetical protein
MLIFYPCKYPDCWNSILLGHISINSFEELIWSHGLGPQWKYVSKRFHSFLILTANLLHSCGLFLHCLNNKYFWMCPNLIKNNCSFEHLTYNTAADCAVHQRQCYFYQSGKFTQFPFKHKVRNSLLLISDGHFCKPR